MHDFGHTSGWTSGAGSFWIKAADPRFADDTFHKDRVGLCEIAFAAGSRADVFVSAEVELHRAAAPR